MKKKVTVNGQSLTVEYSYEFGEIESLSNNKVKRPWGYVTERIETRKAFFTIDGKIYEGTRTFKQAGGPYSETYTFFGKVFHDSHKKVIEYILNNIER